MAARAHLLGEPLHRIRAAAWPRADTRMVQVDNAVVGELAGEVHAFATSQPR